MTEITSRYAAGVCRNERTAIFSERLRRYYPKNEDAERFCAIARMPFLADYMLDEVRGLGFTVEVE